MSRTPTVPSSAFYAQLLSDRLKRNGVSDPRALVVAFTTARIEKVRASK